VWPSLPSTPKRGLTLWREALKLDCVPLKSGRLSCHGFAPRLSPTASCRSHPGRIFLNLRARGPILAALLVVVGYQNVVTYPHLQGELAAVNRPQILASASLINANTRGTDKTVVSVRRGEPFLLFVDIPGDARFSSYMAELQGPNGNSVWSLAVPGEATKDTIPIRVPGDHHEAGMYTLMVRGIDSSGGKGSEIGRYPFELQVRN